MACPRTAQRTEAYGPSVTSVAGRRQHSIILKNRERFFCRYNQLRTYARAVPGRALGKEGIMHATLSPSWKKSLLLVFVSVVAFATATPATSGPQCFFQGLGFLGGETNGSDANGVSANGRVVVGEATVATGVPQAFRWTAASGMVGLG